MLYVNLLRFDLDTPGTGAAGSNLLKKSSNDGLNKKDVPESDGTKRYINITTSYATLSL